MTTEARYKMALEAILPVVKNMKSQSWLETSFAIRDIAQKALEEETDPRGKE